MSLAAKGRMDSLSGGPDRPVIFLSGYGRDETIARALELGVTDYVVKPFSPTELAARIRAALRKQAGPTEPFQYAPVIQAAFEWGFDQTFGPNWQGGARDS